VRKRVVRKREADAKVGQRSGADPNIGPRLPGLLREAAFASIEMKLFHPAALEGVIRLLICITLETIADAVIEDGLASPVERLTTGGALALRKRTSESKFGPACGSRR
jgi:hypothetical protein